MGTLIDHSAGEVIDPIEQLGSGDRQALATLFEHSIASVASP